MRIFWQSFIDQQTSAPYLSYLAAYLTRKSGASSRPSATGSADA